MLQPRITALLTGLCGSLLLLACQQPFYLEEDLEIDYARLGGSRIWAIDGYTSGLMIDATNQQSRSTPITLSVQFEDLVSPDGHYAYFLYQQHQGPGQSRNLRDLYRVDLQDPQLSQAKVGEYTLSGRSGNPYFYETKLMVTGSEPFRALEIRYSPPDSILEWAEISLTDETLTPKQSIAGLHLGFDPRFALSPDQRFLAIATDRNVGRLRQGFLMLLELETGSLTVLKNFAAISWWTFFEIRFSPDGSTMAYTAFRSDLNRTVFGLFPIDAASEEKEYPITPLEFVYFDWSPDGSEVLISEPNRLRLFRPSDESFLDVYRSEGSPRSNSNPLFLQDVYWLE